MKKIFLRSILAGIIIFSLSCQKFSVEDKGANVDESKFISRFNSFSNDGVITGFNENWTNMPDFSDTMIFHNINKLKPQMIRYPGGTITHKWNWQTGRSTLNGGSGWPGDKTHYLGDLGLLVEETGVKIIYDLDIVNSPIENQIEMLDSASYYTGEDIEYIELGNELYAGDTSKHYADKFPSGAAYADTVKRWVQVLKSHYPSVRIAALLFGKIADPATNLRAYQWNDSVSYIINRDSVPIDAYTYHIYIAPGSRASDQISDFNSVKVSDATKDVWITEYGNKNPVTDPYYYEDLNYLADYVESNFQIALCQSIVGNNTPLSKLDTINAHGFTDEGKLFIERVNNVPDVVINEVYNSQQPNGEGDAVELLTIKQNLSMRKMILKNFTSAGNIDSGTRYRFRPTTLWDNIPRGTIILITNSSDPYFPEDTDPSDYSLSFNINNTSYFLKDSTTTANFDVADAKDMWMIKQPNAGTNTDGFANPIHTLFGGGLSGVTTYFSVAPPKLWSATSWSFSEPSYGRTVYCENSGSNISDFMDESGSSATGKSGYYKTLGAANNDFNLAYINFLRNINF